MKNIFLQFSLILLLFTFQISYAVANNHQIIDSLFNELESTHKDISKNEIYSKISYQYQKIDIDSAVIYADKALKTANEMQQYSLIVKGNLTLGNLFFNQGNYNRAIKYYFKALEYSEHHTKDISDLIKVNFNIALVYKCLNDNKSTREYNLKALNYWEVLNKEDTSAAKLISVARIYNNIGITYYIEKENDKALEYFYKALKVSEENNNSEAIPSAYNNIGLIYNSLEDYDIAISFFEKSLNLREQINDFRGIGLTYLYLGRSYREINEKEKAFKFFDNAYKIAKEQNFLDLQLDVAEALVDYYAELGNYKKSYEMNKEYSDVSKQLNIIESSQIAAKFNMQYKFDTFKQQMALDQQRKSFITFIIIVSLLGLLIVITLLFYLSKCKVDHVRLQGEKLKIEKDSLESKLEYRNKELTTNVMYLVRKNELINNISDRLLSIKSDVKNNKKALQDIILELQRNADDDVWKEFEFRFKEVHEEFYNTLNQKFPELSPNEKKLCAFLRLNMSTKDISAITFQTPHSITIARSRLRKKLNINNTNTNLVDFLTDLKQEV